MPYRNFTVEELARHIGMDAREVRRLADRGKLPGQRVGGEWRFNAAQFHEWLQTEMHYLDAAHVCNLERAMFGGDGPQRIAPHLPPECVELHFAARSRASVMRELLKVADRSNMVYDADALLQALEQREQMRSTALPGGVALPHPRRPLPAATAEPLICVARSGGGIPFGAPDGQLTDIFILICAHDERWHLGALARISRMVHAGLAAELRAVASVEALIAAVLAAEEAAIRVGG